MMLSQRNVHPDYEEHHEAAAGCRVISVSVRDPRRQALLKADKKSDYSQRQEAVHEMPSVSR
jgi:hypothetical protein